MWLGRAHLNGQYWFFYQFFHCGRTASQSFANTSGTRYFHVKVETRISSVDTRRRAASCIANAARSYVGVARNLGKTRQGPKYVLQYHPLGAAAGGWHAVYHFCTPRPRAHWAEKSSGGFGRPLVICAWVRSDVLVGQLCSISFAQNGGTVDMYCACSAVHQISRAVDVAPLDRTGCRGGRLTVRTAARRSLTANQAAEPKSILMRIVVTRPAGKHPATDTTHSLLGTELPSSLIHGLGQRLVALDCANTVPVTREGAQREARRIGNARLCRQTLHERRAVHWSRVTALRPLQLMVVPACFHPLLIRQWGQHSAGVPRKQHSCAADDLPHLSVYPRTRNTPHSECRQARRKIRSQDLIESIIWSCINMLPDRVWRRI